MRRLSANMQHSTNLDTLRQTAFDHARAGNFTEAEQALTQVLGEEPQDVGSLLLMGDVLYAAKKAADATKFYGAALQVAGKMGSNIPALFEAGLRRAQQRLSEHRARYESFIEDAVPTALRTPQFKQSVDILFGNARIYLQEPRRYYYPGLPQRQFYDARQFTWADGLEAKTPAIREELRAVLADHNAFKPYVGRNDVQPHAGDHALVDNDDWGAFFLWKNGARLDDNCARCPVTAAAIEALPLDHIPGQAPSVLFSLLKPGAHIPPHNGMINTRLICHLPLLVPGPAWLRVGNQTHHWQEGKLVVFDDSIEHEAKNEADETRVVLLFDIWRPEIETNDRALITKLLAAIAEFTGTAVAAED